MRTLSWYQTIQDKEYHLIQSFLLPSPIKKKKIQFLKLLKPTVWFQYQMALYVVGLGVEPAHSFQFL